MRLLLKQSKTDYLMLSHAAHGQDLVAVGCGFLVEVDGQATRWIDSVDDFAWYERTKFTAELKAADFDFLSPSPSTR